MIETFKLQAQDSSGFVEFRLEDGELTVETTATEACPDCQAAGAHRVHVVLDNADNVGRLGRFLADGAVSIALQGLIDEGKADVRQKSEKSAE